MAETMSGFSLFFPFFPFTLDVMRTSLLKKFFTKMVAKLALEELSCFFSSRKSGLKTSVIGNIFSGMLFPGTCGFLMVVEFLCFSGDLGCKLSSLSSSSKDLLLPHIFSSVETPESILGISEDGEEYCSVGRGKGVGKGGGSEVSNDEDE